MSNLQFADELLPATIAHALRSPFYLRLYDGIDVGTVSTKTINILPLIDRKVVQERIQEICQVDNQRFEELTTGGTSGNPLIFPVTVAEKSFITEFGKRNKDISGDKDLRRGISFKAGTQLQSVETNVPMRCHPINIYDNSSFNHCRNILMHRYTEAGVDATCSVLAGEEMLLRAFTLDCEYMKWNHHDANIDYIISYGDILTPKWRKYYADYWKGEIVDRYGLTEIYGGATQDFQSGLYLFDPQCFAEVVEVEGEKQIQNGLGELVLTPLHPFQQAFPLIRYRTGDLVRVQCNPYGEEFGIAITPLGRINSAVKANDDMLIPGLVFYNALDELPNIGRTSPFLDAAQLKSREYLGRPKYNVCLQEKFIEVKIQMRDGCKLTKNLTNNLENRIRQSYCALTNQQWPTGLDIAILEDKLDGIAMPGFSP